MRLSIFNRATGQIPASIDIDDFTSESIIDEIAESYKNEVDSVVKTSDTVSGTTHYINIETGLANLRDMSPCTPSTLTVPADGATPITLSQMREGTELVIEGPKPRSMTAGGSVKLTFDTPGDYRVTATAPFPALPKTITITVLSTIAAQRAAMLDSIDVAAGDARRRFVSPGDLVDEEYRQAADAVARWRAAGSPAEDVPPEIQAGADYSGITAEQAAVEIETTAAGYAQAMAAIRELRLAGKRATRECADADIDSTGQGVINQLAAITPP